MCFTLYCEGKVVNKYELGEIMKKIIKTNDKHGFSRYTKASMNSRNMKVRDFISTQKQFHRH